MSMMNHRLGQWRIKTVLPALFLSVTLPSTVIGKTEIPDTGQVTCYDHRKKIVCPAPGKPYYGQDAQYRGREPTYRDNGDGTIHDRVTGLMWTKAVDRPKVTIRQALERAGKLTLAGHDDWRVPTIRELYTLIDFRGYTGSDGGGRGGGMPANAIPFINTDFFDFEYGRPQLRERFIDAQWLSRSRYVSLTMGQDRTLFGVNFADGRIKGYGYRKTWAKQDFKRFFVRFVRGAPYGHAQYVDNGDGTISDRNSGLMWMRADSGQAMSWRRALAHCEGSKLAGHDDWRLPNAKTLHLLVDYRRSPDTTHSAAIDPLFKTSQITNEAGQTDFPYYWSSTTHLDGPVAAAKAVYFSFGRAMGRMFGKIQDVHGAGAQRSDPKTGHPGLGHGPQGDAIRIRNHVRCVRGGGVTPNPTGGPEVIAKNRYPNNVAKYRTASTPSTNPRFPGNRPSAKKRGFIQRLDKNGDNRVSRFEFDGPPHMFDHHDRDGDGHLSADEAPHLRRRGRRF